MVLAALCAEGQTTITDVRYIERGYDHLDEKLRSLGANITKIEIEDPSDIASKVTTQNVESSVKESKKVTSE
jgi:hypothetical protein